MANDRFTELVTKYLSDCITAAERAELERSVNADNSLLDRFEFLKAFWKSDRMSYDNSEALFSKIKNRIETTGLQNTALVNKKRKLYTLGIAATLLLGIICFSVYYLTDHTFFRENTGWQTAKVTPGKKSAITLSDGTKVTLNAESSFKYPASFSGNTRDVYLTGEAFFEVKHDASHPFIVHTAKMNVRDVGTSFNVKSYPDDASDEATLIEGSVEITLPDRPADRIILKPKEKLVVDRDAASGDAVNSGINLSTAKNTVPHDTKYTITSLTYFEKHDSTVVETSWLSDKFVFKNEDFGTLCNRLERRFGITINIENDNYRDYRFTGSFAKENIGEVMDVLSYAEPFRYKLNDRKITIY